MKRYDPTLLAVDTSEMIEHPGGDYVLYEDAAKLERERDEWKNAYAAQQQVVIDIGVNLGAKVPYELVNAVARCRMAELAAAHEALNAIRCAGNNASDWAVWAQRTAAWGMAPDKWPKQNEDAPE